MARTSVCQKPVFRWFTWIKDTNKPQDIPGAPNKQIYGKLASQAKFGDCGQNPGAMTAGTHQKNPTVFVKNKPSGRLILQSQSYGQGVASWKFKIQIKSKKKISCFFPFGAVFFSGFILLKFCGGVERDTFGLKKTPFVVFISKRFLGLTIVFVGGHEQWATPPSKMYSRNHMKTSQTF